jgi:hypothetical protein
MFMPGTLTLSLLNATAVGQAGTNLGSCSTTAASPTCSIDGGMVTQGTYLYTQESNNAASTSYTTAFTCQ